MELQPPCHADDLPKQDGSSADNHVEVEVETIGVVVGSYFNEITDSNTLSLAIAKTDVPSQMQEEEKTIVIGSTASAMSHQEKGADMYQNMGTFSLPEKNKGEKRKYKADFEVVDDAAKLQITEVMNGRFVPVKDVKAMLQTGRLEGQQIAYRTNKKNTLNLLDGVIHGTSYFFSCGDCSQSGKALSARAFEQHALKGEHDSNNAHNANDHIVLCSSNISLFEACRKLKEARNEAMMVDAFDMIIKKNDCVVVTEKKDADVDDKFIDADLVQSVRTMQKKDGNDSSSSGYNREEYRFFLQRNG